MPKPRAPTSLLDLSCESLSGTLYASLKRLELLWKPPPAPTSRITSPNTSPVSLANRNIISPPVENFIVLGSTTVQVPNHHFHPAAQLNNQEAMEYEANEENRLAKILDVRRWLMALPLSLMEYVVEKAMDHIEGILSEDKDRKLILTLINIEKLNHSDLFFGMHALLDIISHSGIKHIKGSSKLFCALWEYSQIVSSSSLSNKICESIPKLSSLRYLCLPHMASDKICYLISRHLPDLEYLCLDHSPITDKGVKLIAGIRPTQSQQNEYEPNCSPGSASFICFGNYCLRKISIKNCMEVSDFAVWTLISRLPSLTVLEYLNTFSVAEILTKECSQLSDEDLKHLKLPLTHYNHPFPYSLDSSKESVRKVLLACSNITTMNVVTKDANVEIFCQMSKLKSVTLELEDCFGMGLFKLLEKLGSQLNELTISCSSDAEYTTLLEGGQPFQLFNVGLKLARKFCNKSLKSLEVAGCGLVSNMLLDELTKTSYFDHLIELTTLLFLAYEDDNPIQTCEERLLFDTLTGCRKLTILSLEGNFSSFLDDSFLSRLLANNPMHDLSILDFQGHPYSLSLSSAMRVLQLPNLHEVRFSSWDLSDQQIDHLKSVTLHQGFNVIFRK